MFLEKRKFKNSKGLTLSAIYEGEDKSAPVVVLCHGYGSSKYSKTTQMLSKKLVSDGISTFRFDFTGCGDSEGNIKDLTPNTGLDDLESAIKNLDKEKFALYGSSYGGYVALIWATEHPLLALGLRAPVSDYMAVIKLEGNEKENRENKFATEAAKINIYHGAKNITCPTLVVHGDIDDVVPLSQSQKLIKSLGGEKQLALIHKATHDFSNANIEDTTSLLREFFRNKLL